MAEPLLYWSSAESHIERLQATTYLLKAFHERAFKERFQLFRSTLAHRSLKGLSDEDLQRIETVLGLKPVDLYFNEGNQRNVITFADEDLTTFIVWNLARIDITSCSEGRMLQVKELLREWFPQNFDGKREIYTFTQSSDGFDMPMLGFETETLQRENYTPSVLAGYDKIVQEFNSQKPKGRLAIISGHPGTGKTYLLRGLAFDLSSCKMVIVKPEEVSMIASSKGLGALLDRHDENLVFVIEDADACLVPRAADNMSSISSLLNLGDGFLGSILNVRIIATTNAKKVEFDPALSRPGRLCCQFEVPPLVPDHANQVYQRVAERPAPGPYVKAVTLAQVYEDAAKPVES